MADDSFLFSGECCKFYLICLLLARHLTSLRGHREWGIGLVLNSTQFRLLLLGAN
jgi:hypothetical protein